LYYGEIAAGQSNYGMSNLAIGFDLVADKDPNILP
jgi:hypothetical protein